MGHDFTSISGITSYSPGIIPTSLSLAAFPLAFSTKAIDLQAAAGDTVSLHVYGARGFN